MLVTEPNLELSSDSEVGERPGIELHTRGSQERAPAMPASPLETGGRQLR